MMAKRKKTITIETRQRTIIRPGSPLIKQIWCEFCAAEVEITAPKPAARLLGLTERGIFRRIEQGDLHFFETETGEVFICKSFLLQ